MWVMDCRYPAKGVFYHGSRDETQDTDWSLQGLIEVDSIEEITEEEAIKNLGDWQDGINSINSIIARYNYKEKEWEDQF